MNENMSQRRALLCVASRIKKYWYMLFTSLMLAIVFVVLSLYVPKLIGYGTDKIISEGNVDFKGLTDIVIKIAVSAGIAAIAQWLMGLCNNRITYRVIKDIRQEAFDKIQKVPLSYLDRHSNGDMVSRIIADVDQLADGLLMGFSQAFTGVITIILTLVFMVTINWKIAVVVIFITPLSFVVANFIAKRTYAMFIKQSKTRGEQTAFVDEILGGQKVVKAFSQEEKMIEQFDEINQRLKYYYQKGTFYSSLTNPSTRFVNNLVYAGVAISGGLVAVLSGGITVGSLTCILSYANQYTKPFNEISGVITELQNAIACGGRVFSLIGTEPEVVTGNEKEMETAKGQICLEHVDFSYVSNKKLIEDLNLIVQPGQRIAIVGPTGCGKTTLINLLMRFYDVKVGSIKVDGTDIRDVTRTSLRDSYGMVLQETWLRNDTIRNNIAMAAPDATDEEIIQAAKATHAHSFIKRLPKGYDTVIGEDGGSLSQGQKQLLCITRVMLKLPPMLILDEATSSIDTRTEIRIQRAFAKLMKGRTTFVVAHRLSTIKESDVILVMKDGHVIEQGNHESLLKEKGFYYELYNSQYAH